ncbi:collagen adhesin family protein [Parvimonas sp. oral taxon 393 str. F0440]|nr:collagen adhesin family protein [Parvimonas sp. oral taxon 393 str. F0440]
MPWAPMIPPTRDIKVIKEWKNFLGTDAEAPVEKIEVELYKDGVATGKKAELTKANNWTATFEKLEVADGLGSTNYYQYTVKEVGENGSAIQLNNKWYGVSYGGTMKDGFTITNKEKMPWTPMEIPTRDLKVTKTWDLLEGHTMPVNEIEVELFKDNVSTGKKLTLNEANNWTATFEKLPVSATLGGANHNYTVKEVGENGSAIQLNNKWYGVAYAGTMKDGFTITNKEKTPWTPMISPTRDIKVTKEWKDIKGNVIEAPVEKIEVELYKDGVATGKKVELTKANNWTATFEKLEVADGLGSTNYYQYTVKEVGESENAIKFGSNSYNVSYSGSMKGGFTITNKNVEIPKPLKPSTKLPKTGSSNDLSLYIYCILTSVTLLGLIAYRRNKYTK